MRGRDDPEAGVDGQARPMVIPDVARLFAGKVIPNQGVLLRLSSTELRGRWMTKNPWSAALWQEEHASDRPS